MIQWCPITDQVRNTRSRSEAESSSRGQPTTKEAVGLLWWALTLWLPGPAWQWRPEPLRGGAGECPGISEAQNHVVKALVLKKPVAKPRALLPSRLGGAQTALGLGVFSRPGKEEEFKSKVEPHPGLAWPAGSQHSSGRKLSFLQRWA